jgi:GT2 family glycosyltransferase
MGDSLAAVVIGRNEGARLVRCLSSLAGGVARIVYVDSGSTDGSVEAARGLGALVVTLDPALPFTAARARNAGWAALETDPPDAVLFVDGDCEVQPGWITTAQAFLAAHPKVAVVCGRRRERFPEASVYNRLCDREWNRPAGETASCGGDALIRWAALTAVGGYDPGLIAGEEPDMCLRLRDRGWTIWRLNAEMTLHDAAITRLSQWAKRCRRTGHAYAEGAFRHGGARLGGPGQRRALIWGVILPLLALSGTAFTPWATLLFLAWPLQILRLAARPPQRFARETWEEAFFLTLAKFPEARGVVTFHIGRLMGRRQRLIEYK